MSSDEPELPSFRYFPDPLGNGCIVARDATCPCCGETRSHIYSGPIYAVENIHEVCPWCIADGSAARRWSASFNDTEGAADSVPPEVLREIDERTPGYSSWQGNRWLFAQDDAMVFVGEVDGKALLEDGDDGKIEACLAALREWDPNWPKESLAAVTPGDQPAIYLFRDRKSGTYAAYADMT